MKSHNKIERNLQQVSIYTLLIPHGPYSTECNATYPHFALS